MEWESQSNPSSLSSNHSLNNVGTSRPDKVPALKQISPSPSVAALSKLTDEELRRKGVEDLIRILRRVETDYKSLLAEHGNIVKDVNRRFQIFVLETHELKESNQKLQDDNQELRDLCCFLDDDRQRSRKLAREWQRFGRYTASVMRSEVAVYQDKLKELENKQNDLVTENMELKELCLFLDQERARITGDRDEGDGSSNGTVTGHEDGIIPIEPAGLTMNIPVSSSYPLSASSTASYVQELERKVLLLEEEKALLAQRVDRNGADGLDVANSGVDKSTNGSLATSGGNLQSLHGLRPSTPVLRKSPVSGKPETVLHAMKVLQVHEELEKMPAEHEGLDDPEKAIVREMCNVVWRTIGDAEDIGSFNESADSIQVPLYLPESYHRQSAPASSGQPRILGYSDGSQKPYVGTVNPTKIDSQTSISQNDRSAGQSAFYSQHSRHDSQRPLGSHDLSRPSEIRSDFSRPPEVRPDFSRVTDLNDPSRLRDLRNDPSRLADPRNDPSRLADARNDSTRLADPRNDPSQLADTRNDLSRFADPRNDPSRLSGSRKDPSKFSETRNDPSRLVDIRNDPSRLPESRNEPSQSLESRYQPSNQQQQLYMQGQIDLQGKIWQNSNSERIADHSRNVSQQETISKHNERKIPPSVSDRSGKLSTMHQTPYPPSSSHQNQYSHGFTESVNNQSSQKFLDVTGRSATHQPTQQQQQQFSSHHQQHSLSNQNSHAQQLNKAADLAARAAVQSGLHQQKPSSSPTPHPSAMMNNPNPKSLDPQLGHQHSASGHSQPGDWTGSGRVKDSSSVLQRGAQPYSHQQVKLLDAPGAGRHLQQRPLQPPHNRDTDDPASHNRQHSSGVDYHDGKMAEREALSHQAQRSLLASTQQPSLQTQNVHGIRSSQHLKGPSVFRAYPPQLGSLPSQTGLPKESSDFAGDGQDFRGHLQPGSQQQNKNGAAGRRLPEQEWRQTYLDDSETL